MHSILQAAFAGAHYEYIFMWKINLFMKSARRRRLGSKDRYIFLLRTRFKTRRATARKTLDVEAARQSAHRKM